MGTSGRCPALAAETSSAGDRAQAPRAPEPTAPTAQPALAPQQHPRPARAAPLLPLPAPSPRQRVGGRRERPQVSLHHPPPIFYLSSISQNTRILRTNQRSARMQAPSFPAMEAHP